MSPTVHAQFHPTARLGGAWGLKPTIALAVTATIAVFTALATSSPDESLTARNDTDGIVTISMVETLETSDLSNPVSLEDLSLDVLEEFIEAGSDGTGVDVALIDTGVAPVEGLAGVHKVVHGPDLSLEGDVGDIAYLDTYGHGTHMAGIIAGERPGQEGIAPGARIVSVKVAGFDGITTVDQVVAAIDWVVDHRQSDGLNVRVLNLSLGQAGVSSHIGDPLSAAVERAWHAGIFVVVSVGNRGASQGHLDSPAIDPYVMAVGASDSSTGEDDLAQPVASWSSQGDDIRNPDLVAPGRSIASYRVPGSTVDTNVPSARVGDGLFLGSGTSQAAAVVSGVAARMFDHFPNMSNEALWQTLRKSARTDLDIAERAIGSGVIDAEGAYERPKRPKFRLYPPAAGPGAGLTAPSGGTWSGGTWSGGTWSGGTWSGGTWSGGTWSGGTWSGGTWSGGTWSGGTWSGGTWSGGTWSGGTWSGGTWSGRAPGPNGWA